ncbi:hypothetical protein DM02DRAFT_664754 [Periconia macrospinosa]|uniref:J domain-containing protein n=1 Tax=Periconia macrospinosa TaxID=97972 RepID=A0A2V1CZF8_9PLEO|nr:hypothetical protein DM02DRAFT_664754 [Periconia macrospinosa]
MARIVVPNLEDVDIFNLLNVNPHKLRNLSIAIILKAIQTAYRTKMRTVHPDKARTGHLDPKPAQQLNALKDFLCNFDEREVNPGTIRKLVEEGCRQRVSRPGRHRSRRTPMLRRGIPPPGSSLLNPIVLDAPALTSSNPIDAPGSSSSSPVSLDAPGTSTASSEQERTENMRARRRRRSRRNTKAYHLSRGTWWVGRAYAHGSDIRSVWEQD